ncbi:hypothetical protein LSH36_926g00057 [Paralvinella palmiformis]|uniref:Uncharacterized protein n=2 Tax=Paralvinella palmiformis TaxID=53620 RepID=A0AAD9IYJ5_9ANNE|nr:hypothetical protein LSH36_926g00057 [Paralvinella palmiformis]
MDSCVIGWVIVYSLLERFMISVADHDVLTSLKFGNNVVPCQLGNHLRLGEASKEQVGHDQGVQVTWPGVAHLSITSSDIPTDYSVTCQDVTWMAEDCRVTVFEDCFSLDGAHWYGGGARNMLLWPIEKWDVEMEPFVSDDGYSGYSGVVERYWLNSNGLSIYVNSEVPLWVSLNSTGDQQLCLRATYDNSPYNNYDQSQVFLNYTVCQGANVKETQLFAFENFFDKPFDIPDETLFRYPIYSTWARHHQNITQDKVMAYANEIIYYNYSNAQMEIDDDWESNYGQLDFSLEKFPDPQGMVEQLGDMGFRVTVWVHPFTDIVPENDWLGGLKDPGGQLPALISWWNGVASTIDFTETESVDEWNRKLANLRQSYGISSFKFDAGETNYLPAAYRPAVPFRNPCDYATKYAEVAYLADPDVRHQEVRVGYRTQRLPIYVRLLDKTSRWNHENGLRTVIPHVLLFSIIGYPFSLPDMIGGNAYSGRFPDRELFIRWTELNVFLPGFQFSIVPWQYDEQVIEICRDMLTLHEQYADLMIELARNATQTGEPIVRPLWWLAPEDAVALEIDSEFLVGNDLLVAPVVEEGATSRDVYLPVGSWRDMNDVGVVLDGGRWYYNYSAPLDFLPYFTRLA